MVALLVGAVATWVAVAPSKPEPAQPKVFPLEIESFELDPFGIAISPDGRYVAFGARMDGRAQMFLRQIDRLGTTLIYEGRVASTPFFSPESDWVGFTAGPLKKVSVAGSEPFSLLEEAPGARPHGTWSADGSIIYSEEANGLMRVPDVGGAPEIIAAPDAEAGQVSFWRPSMLPDDSGVLFDVFHTDGDPSIAVLSFATGDVTELVNGTDPVYAPTGHIVYARGATLFAVPFDLATHRVAGRPAPVMQGVRGSRGNSMFAISEEGTLVWVPGSATDAAALRMFGFEFVDSEGAREPTTIAPQAFDRLARLSPDGRKVAATVRSELDQSDIFVIELDQGGNGQRLTTDGASSSPVWSLDGEWIYFEVHRDGGSGIYRRKADFRGAAEAVLEQEGFHMPLDVHPTEDMLLIMHKTAGAAPNDDISMFSRADQTLEAVADSEFNERFPRLSPDGRFVAYRSDETDLWEVYVRSLVTGETIKASPSGGGFPFWSLDGAELYFRGLVNRVGLGQVFGGPLMVVDFNADPLSTENARMYLPMGPRETPHGIAPDGRLLVRTPVATESDAEELQPTINVYLNWFEVLKAIEPTGR